MTGLRRLTRERLTSLIGLDQFDQAFDQFDRAGRTRPLALDPFAVTSLQRLTSLIELVKGRAPRRRHARPLRPGAARSKRLARV